MTNEIEAFLHRHLASIFDGDSDTYHATCAVDLSLYEWYVVPQRIDGLPFHDFMMTETTREDTAATPLTLNTGTGEKPRTRYDLANLRIQAYGGHTAIASYTMMISQSVGGNITVTAYNESRVMAMFEDGWRVVHVHKSPAYKSPLSQ